LALVGGEKDISNKYITPAILPRQEVLSPPNFLRLTVRAERAQGFF
jgi:hypothetical protein